MAGIDVNRGTTGVSLPPEVSGEIWGKILEQSAIMQLARQVELPGNGVSMDIITGDAAATWTAETDEKGISRPGLATKTMTPYTLAVIVPFSNQFRRDKAKLYEEIVRRLPGALARKFDATVFGNATAPGSNFDTLALAEEIDIATDTYGGLVAADGAIAEADGLLTGWALSPKAKALLLDARDSALRPLMINNIQTDGAVPALLGSPAYYAKAAYKVGDATHDSQLGFAGDWSTAVYGTVEGVKIDIADQASLTDGEATLNLFQRNMFAVRAEIEIGFRMQDIALFAKLTDGTKVTAE